MTLNLSSLVTNLAPTMANHLWQSTAFAAVIWALTSLMYRNRAAIRYALWLTASLKFLIPFSFLIALGNSLWQPRQAPLGTQITIYSAIDIASQPFHGDLISNLAATPHAAILMERFSTNLPVAIFALWFVGASIVLLRWAMRWRQVNAMCRRALSVEAGREFEILRRLENRTGSKQPLRILLSPDLMEPGIFGVIRPVLLWPRQLSDHLDDEHIEAILAHELLHVQRRDNLTAALHMVVEALFWFHPLVWAIEHRLVEERELACDEAVIQRGGRPETYAESLLKACRFCIESPLTCVAGITGADLNRRIVTIMTRSLGQNLGLVRRALLIAIATTAIAAPLMLGQVNATLRMAIVAPTAPPPPPPPPPLG